MADLMLPSSPALLATPTSSSSAAGGGAMDAQNVTTPQHHHSAPLLSQNLLQSSGASASSSPSSNGTAAHPQSNSLINNGHKICTIPDDNQNNYNNAHHSHLSSAQQTTLSLSPVAGVSSSSEVHTRNHHPLLSSCANNNHVDSSSVAPEMGMAAGLVAALPSSFNKSSSSSATTMDILNLDFVNGNSSYCHNTAHQNNEQDNPSPLSCWHNTAEMSQLESQEQLTTGGDHNAHVQNHRDPQSVMLNVVNNSALIGADSSVALNNVSSAKVPGEIPDSVMKYLLTKTDSVDSTKSTNSATSSSTSSPGSTGAPCLSAEHSTHHHSKRLQEFLVDLDALQSTTEIAKVLENFNAILEKIEQEDDKEALEGLEALTTPLSPTVLQCPTATVSSTSRIKNSVETLADLLLSGCGDEEDEDLLIIIDENDSESSLQAGVPVLQTSSGSVLNKCAEIGVLIETNGDVSIEEEDELDDVSSLVEIEADLGDLDQEEGYESDRPIVRASMRKLRPVRLLPMPSQHSHHHSSNNHATHPAFTTPPPTPVTPRANSPVDPNLMATNLSSPIPIIVTSLMNNLSCPGASQNSPESNQPNCGHLVEHDALPSCSSAAVQSGHHNGSFVPTLEVLHVASGSGHNSQSRCHSRSQSGSSQIIQFHHNSPATVTTNPMGFPEVSVANGPSCSQPTTSTNSQNSSTINGAPRQQTSTTNTNITGVTST